MATVRKRGTAWQVQVRLEGHPPVNKTFKRKIDGERWARQTETELQQGTYKQADRKLKDTSVKDLLIRYRDTITPKKKSCQDETYRLNRLIGYPIAKVKLSELSSSVASGFRDERLKQVSGATVRRELTVLRHCFEVAKVDSGYEIINPVRLIKIPPSTPARERRLQEGELEVLLKDCSVRKRPVTPALFSSFLLR